MKKSLIAFSEDSFIFKHKKLFIIIILIINMLLCSLYLKFSQIKHQQSESQVAIMLAESLASQINLKDISALSGNLNDLEKSEYLLL